MARLGHDPGPRPRYVGAVETPGKHPEARDLEILVWLADAFAYSFERGECGLRPYLSAVADEVLFEAEPGPWVRARTGYPDFAGSSCFCHPHQNRRYREIIGGGTVSGGTDRARLG